MESLQSGYDLGTCVVKHVQKRIAIMLCDLEASLGARACVQVLCVQKTQCFAFALLSP